MKRFLVIFMVLVCLLSIANVTYGASGKAVLPMYFAFSSVGNDCCTYVNLSNITTSPINVTVTLFKNDGSILTSNITATNLLNVSTPSNASISFTLNGNHSGNLTISGLSIQTSGYGIIEWTQSSTNVYGLVAIATWCQTLSTSVSRYSIPINNGLPF